MKTARVFRLDQFRPMVVFSTKRGAAGDWGLALMVDGRWVWVGI